MKKDYFKYENGKIEYEKSLKDKLKETFAYIKENKKFPPNENLLSIFYYAKPSKAFSPKNIIKGLLVTAIIATISLSVYTFKSQPSINLSSQNNGTVNRPNANNTDIINSTLAAIEQEELNFYHSYLDGKISGVYAKKSANKFIVSKNHLLTESYKDTSLDSSVLESINLSISFSESLVSAISSYDNVAIKEILATKY